MVLRTLHSHRMFQDLGISYRVSISVLGLLQNNISIRRLMPPLPARINREINCKRSLRMLTDLINLPSFLTCDHASECGQLTDTNHLISIYVNNMSLCTIGCIYLAYIQKIKVTLLNRLRLGNFEALREPLFNVRAEMQNFYKSTSFSGINSARNQPDGKSTILKTLELSFYQQLMKQ